MRVDLHATPACSEKPVHANPSVRVRIGDENFVGEAREVSFDSAEHDRVRELPVTKYATEDNDLSRWRATAFPVAIAIRPV